MRKSPRVLALLPRWLPRAVASVALLLAALQQAAHTQAVHAQADPAAVFRQAVDARNRGDLEGVMAAFADDAVRQDASCLPPCVGAAAIRQSMQANIDAGHQATVLAAEAGGDTLTVRAEVRSDTFRAGGAERIVTIFRVELRDGKIVLWSSNLDTSDAETAAFTARRAGPWQAGDGSRSRGGRAGRGARAGDDRGGGTRGRPWGRRAGPPAAPLRRWNRGAA